MALRSMTDRQNKHRYKRRALLLRSRNLAIATLGASLPIELFAQSTANLQKLTIPLLTLNDDPRFEARRLERGYLGQAQGSAADGIASALQSSSFELDAAKVSVAVTPIRVATIDQAKSEAIKLSQAGALLFVSELPAAWLTAISDSTKTAVVNVSEADDVLREAQCKSNLFHVVPSERMRCDALAQILLTRRWNKVLLLAGENPEDQRRAEIATRSLQRFNIKLVAKKSFKLSGDPRERQLSNVALLTANQEFDALWIVDSDGEFARSIPYRLPQPRPVVGDAGLVPVAWDPRFDRYGAPQVSKAFTKQFKRPMVGHDWAAWFTGRLLISTFVPLATGSGAKKITAIEVLKTLSSPDLKVDGSKGQVLSFRPWDRQLRQPIMLSDGQGVIEVAPLEGVMHPRSVLDSLGADAPEKLCKATT
jgi:ABC transporter substrate binding protein (PQQ-dependent alcohol dehydrogenase system)